MSLFEAASRAKYRFSSSKGLLTVEDLWDLPLKGNTSLDAIAKHLNRLIRLEGEESFVDEPTKDQNENASKLELVKHIIRVRLDEAKEAQEKVVKAQRAEKIREILSRKQDMALEAMTEEDLRKMLEQ